MFEKVFQRFLEKIYKYPGRILIIFILISLLGVFGATRLGLSTSLSRLLPDDTPSVLTAKEASNRIGSTDFLIIAITSPDPLLNKKVADEVVRIMSREMDELNEVTAKLELDFFKKNGLLYFTPEKLRKIDEQLKKVLGMEKQKSMGLLVLPKGKNPEEKKLKEMIKSGKNNTNIPDSIKKEEDKPDELKEYISSPDGKILAVMGRPKSMATNMSFARKLVEQSRKIIARVKEKFPDKDLKIEVGGSYRNRVREYDSIISDVISSFLVSFLLIVLLILLFFRSFRPIPIIFIPLLSGIVVTLGLVRAFQLEKLNIITVFIGGILLGMGIDFGVHLSARYMEERGGGKGQKEALFSTMLNTGRALITAGLTTAGALYLLFFSSFRGFWEFGLIAGTGLIITLFIFLFFFPVATILLEKLFPMKEKKFLPLSTKGNKNKKVPIISLVLLFFGIIFTIVVVITGLPNLQFESNFRRLTGNSSTKIKYGKAMGDNASPTVVLCDTQKDCTFFARYLESLINSSLPNPEIRDYLALSSFIPEKQSKKLVTISRLRRRITKAKSWADKDLKKRLDDIFEYIPKKKIMAENLPEWLRRRFREKTGIMGKFLYIYPARDTKNAHEAALFKEKYANFDLNRLDFVSDSAGKVRAASSSFIMVDIIRIVKDEGIKIFGAALLFVFILLLFDFRSFISSLFVFIPLVIGLIWTASLLPILGQRLGLYNMVVLSTIVGAGIDGSVHLYHGMNEKGVSRRRSLFRTALAVIVASLTTMAGFSGMMAADHGGLSSIGRLATIGIFSTLAASLLFVPSFIFVRDWIKSES
ncbi:MAG: efflux RND transporter permease subunit [Myxococcota bacterium]